MRVDFSPLKVDNNVTRHLDRVLKRGDWDVLILHYLGLDHIGHTSGPGSPLIGRKLSEMDGVLAKIHTALLAEVRCRRAAGPPLPGHRAAHVNAGRPAGTCAPPRCLGLPAALEQSGGERLWASLPSPVLQLTVANRTPPLWPCPSRGRWSLCSSQEANRKHSEWMRSVLGGDRCQRKPAARSGERRQRERT